MQYDSKKSERLLVSFILGWALLNIIQASFVDLHADEAYYWLYSKFLDWGFFDHPPMVAIFVKLGDSFMHNQLALRFTTIITTSISIFILWKIVSVYSNNIRVFLLLFSTIVLFHVYGFITTPDSPLFFFTILFFYVYQQYIKEDSYKWSAILAVVIACLLYSKYHAILVLFFTILSNLKLFKRPTFWVIIALSIVVFLPHIWWQIQNNYPSFYYHVIDRSAYAYQFEFTYQYLLAQLALAGPLIGWFLYKLAAMHKPEDIFIKAIKFNFIGIFFFFLLTTLKGRVEGHWTLPAMTCLFILAYLALSNRELPKWFTKLAYINIAMIVFVRLVLIFPIDALQKINLVADYFGAQRWADKIKEKAGNSPVIFLDSFQIPSRYNFYTNSTHGFAYDSRYYRKNQYDIWPLEDSIRNRKAYYVVQHGHGTATQDTINTGKGVFYGDWIQKVRMYQKVTVNPISIPGIWSKKEIVNLRLKINNPYDEHISFSNDGERWKCYLEYGYMQLGKVVEEFKPVDANLFKITLAPGQTAALDCKIQAPKTDGKFKLIFSLRTEPFSGSRNSNMIPVVVM
ncbi:MAG: glycosyltransferase family 39 protein [Pedobacter sp.]|nr:MAG: glycosyltransferase family 39 protein [Pedobacter sp.]